MAIVRANTPFSCVDSDGRKVFVAVGDLVDGSDRVVAQVPANFDPVEAHVRPVLGQSAAPVEKVKRTAKKAAGY